MKKILLLSTLAIVLLAGATNVYVSGIKPPKVEPPVVSTHYSKPQEPVQPTEPVVVPETPPEAPQTTPEPVVIVPSNDDLIAQYGFDSSIDYIMMTYPQYFTEAERERAFAYLNSVVTSNKNIGEGKVINSLAFVKDYFMQHYIDHSWANVGLLAGVDASYYIWW